MPIIDWNNLLLLSEWAGALRQLLEAAEEAIESHILAQRQQVNQLLKRFIKESPVDAGPLDDIATAAIIDVNLAVIEDALFAIKQRQAELQKLNDLILGVTDQAKSSTEKLRLDKLKKAVDHTKTALEGLKAVNDITGKAGSSLTKKLDKLVADLDNLEQNE